MSLKKAKVRLVTGKGFTLVTGSSPFQGSSPIIYRCIMDSPSAYLETISPGKSPGLFFYVKGRFAKRGVKHVIMQ